MQSFYSVQKTRRETMMGLKTQMEQRRLTVRMKEHVILLGRVIQLDPVMP